MEPLRDSPAPSRAPSTRAASTRPNSLMWSMPSTTTSIDGGERRSSKGSITRAYSPDWKLYTGFAGLCLLVLAAAIDGTMLLAGLPVVMTKLKGTTTEAIWTSASYHLASSIFQPAFVSISFIFGRKPLVAAAALLAVAGSVVGGIAPNSTILILGETLQGAGGGATTALAELITSDLIPTEFKGRWLMILNIFWAFGCTGGTVLGAVLAETGLWRMIFWLNIALHVAGGVLAMLLDIRIRTAKSPWKAVLKVDWIGFILFIISFTSVLMAISLGKVVYPWSDWRMIVLIVVGFFSTLAFLIVETFYVVNPFIELYRLQDLSAFVTFITTFLHGFVFWALLSFLPIYYQSVQKLSVIQSALALLPETATLIPGLVLVGLVIAKTARYKWILFASWAITCIGTGLLALFDTGTTTTIWIVVNVLAGVGIAAIFAGLVFASQATATAMKQDFAFGCSMLHVFRSSGAAVAITASGTIFQQEFFKRVGSIESLAESASKHTNNAISLAHQISKLPFDLNSDEQLKFIEAYAYGLKKIWLAVVILACSGTVLCVFAKEFGEHVYSRLGGAEAEKGKADQIEHVRGDAEAGRSRAGSITVDVEMSQGFSR